MVNADLETEKSSYGFFERFLYIFFIPTLFLLLLLGVLLTLFDYNVKDSVLTLANKIPLVNSFIPDPAVKPGEPKEVMNIKDDKIKSLTAALAQKESALNQSLSEAKQNDATIQELQANITALKAEMAQKKLTAEEYTAKIQSLASMYGSMSPSKAAPILQNLTSAELILILSEMKPEDRINVLQKMDPKTAAKASIQLKDVVPVDVRAIAALQERLDVYKKEDPSAVNKLNKTDLALTFSNMSAKNAAAVLLEMNKSNSNQVVEILVAMNSQARSNVLSAIADLSEGTAAAISKKLGE